MAMNISNCSVNITINNCVPSKACTKCLEVKPLTEFHKNKKYKDGYQYYCIQCRKPLKKAEYERNKERYLTNHKIYYQKNKEQLSEYKRQYCENNKEKINEYKRKYQNERYHSDEHYKNHVLLHSRINKLLKGEDNSIKTQKLLGCNLEWFKKWLEFQFNKEMNWENRGTYWDVDRVVPCVSFNLSDPEEQKKCFNWSNTQPMTKQENK